MTLTLGQLLLHGTVKQYEQTSNTIHVFVTEPSYVPYKYIYNNKASFAQFQLSINYCLLTGITSLPATAMPVLVFLLSPPKKRTP